MKWDDSAASQNEPVLLLFSFLFLLHFLSAVNSVSAFVTSYKQSLNAIQGKEKGRWTKSKSVEGARREREERMPLMHLRDTPLPTRVLPLPCLYRWVPPSLRRVQGTTGTDLPCTEPFNGEAGFDHLPPSPPFFFFFSHTA